MNNQFKKFFMWSLRGTFTLFSVNSAEAISSFSKVRLLIKIIIISLFIIHNSSFIIDCSAAFKDTGWGARPLGMAGAFTAIVNDSNAPLFNPAGLAQIPQMEVSFASARLFAGLEAVDVGLNYFSYFYPINQRTGNFAISWASISSPALYREDTGSISYGRYIDDIFGNEGNNITIALGVNLKYLRNEYDMNIRTINDPVFEKGSSAGAMTFDSGILVNWQETGLSFGLAIKNITRPNIGLKTNEFVPIENVLGLAYYNENMPYIKLPYFTVAFDLVSREKNFDYRIGTESWLFDGKFALRLGARAQEVAFGLGYEIMVMEQTKLIIDYAFAWPFEIEQTIGSHRLGLTLRFP